MAEGARVEAELAALAASGATALVQRMVGDGWDQVRGRLAGLFSRRGGAQEDDTRADEDAGRIEEELDASREELIAARDAGDTGTESDVRAEWRSRLRRALVADPALASELRALLTELTGRDPDDQGGNTYNTINGGVHQGPVIQARTIGGNVDLGRPPQGPG